MPADISDSYNSNHVTRSTTQFTRFVSLSIFASCQPSRNCLFYSNVAVKKQNRKPNIPLLGSLFLSSKKQNFYFVILFFFVSLLSSVLIFPSLPHHQFITTQKNLSAVSHLFLKNFSLSVVFFEQQSFV